MKKIFQSRSKRGLVLGSILAAILLIGGYSTIANARRAGSRQTGSTANVSSPAQVPDRVPGPEFDRDDDPECARTAADVNRDTLVNTDVIAIQRFALALSTGIANAGKHQFSPANRSYTPLTNNQTAQNYDALIFGDVVSPFTAP